MASKGNLAWQMNGMSSGRAASSVRLDVIYETTDGIVFGVTNATAISTLTALIDQQSLKLAPGCLIIPVNSVACTVASARLWQNISDDVSPVITAVTDQI